MTTVRKYLSLIKFSHTIFAMPFALIGFFLGVFADTSIIPGWNALLIKLFFVILCMIFARSAAMSFNRYLDRKFDERNPRTATREVPAGIISPQNALIFSITCSALFMAACYFINSLCFLLSPVALIIVLGYSYTKRFTPLCHLILGLGLSLAPIGAYLAVTGSFDLLPLLFSFAVICWVSGFDIIYALQDVEFDQSQNLYSIPSWLGKQKGLRISELLHLACAGFIIYAGVFGKFHWLYWSGTIIFIGMLVYQHIIVKPDDLRKVNLAFMTANGIASILFALFVIADLYFHR